MIIKYDKIKFIISWKCINRFSFYLISIPYRFFYYHRYASIQGILIVIGKMGLSSVK